jgi:hypothetical protein
MSGPAGPSENDTNPDEVRHDQPDDECLPLLPVHVRRVCLRDRRCPDVRVLLPVRCGVPL